MSGHIGETILLAALRGPSPAFIVMAGVLLISPPSKLKFCFSVCRTFKERT